ncbi:MAG: hypothetical protein NT068_00685 [Candidatus Nomurabacteria bacterium]|nr:hypothetical protein [Candidatus Nomurabacteria bacterium]
MKKNALENVSNLLFDNISNLLEPIIKKVNSHKYPSFRGLGMSRQFPIFKIENKVWYNFVIKMEWYSDITSTSPSYLIILFIYIPVNKTDEVRVFFNKPKLKSNTDTLLLNKSVEVFESLIKKHKWNIKYMSKKEFDSFQKEGKNPILTSKEEEKILNSF